MVVLEVGIDAQGAVTGAQQAFSAMSQLATAAGFATEQMADANMAVGRMSLALRAAQPWLVAVTTAISGTAMVMSLMSRATKEAASEWDKLATSVGKAETSIRAAMALGRSTSPFTTALANQQVSAYERSLADNRPMDLANISGVVGDAFGQMDMIRLAAAGGNEQAKQYLRTGGYTVGTELVSLMEGGGYERSIYSQDPGRIQISPEMQQRLFREAYKVYNNRAQMESSAEGRMRAVGEFGPDPLESAMSLPGYSGIGPYLPGTSGDAMATGSAIGWHTRNAADAAASSLREQREAMRELKQDAQQLGQYLGDAAFDFVAGLRDGREVLGSMAMDFGRILMRQAMTQASQWAFGATG